ncbi:hypothetical protein D3C75_1240110 [compost metagenome]
MPIACFSVARLVSIVSGSDAQAFTPWIGACTDQEMPSSLLQRSSSVCCVSLQLSNSRWPSSTMISIWLQPEAVSRFNASASGRPIQVKVEML